MSEQELWNELGNLYFLSGSYNQASYAYHRSIQLDENFGRPYSNLALTYVQQGKLDEAIDLYRRSIELLTENKEKAVSWNRLGTVYRHLKDYSKAVIAFQEADELDPESASEFPVSLEAQKDSSPVSSSDLDVAAAEPEDMQPEVEWWDVDEERVEAATHAETADPASSDDPHESWTAADPSQFQQDLSQMPETGSLTTWRDAEPEDEFEFFSPLDPAPEVSLPDTDDDLSTWLPIPEEEPFDADLLQVPPFLEQIEVEPPDPQPEPIEMPPYHVLEITDYGSLLPAQAATSATSDFMQDTDAPSITQSSGLQTREQQKLDVIVEERAAADLAYAESELPQQAEPELAAPQAQTEITVSESPDTCSTTWAPERDEEEMREIEMGIEKFRRVVQLNPRNAHAWDALGTLFKSAGLYRDAILAYQQAISNDSSKSLYYHHLGLVYACEGRDEDAISTFQQVLEIDPEYSLAHATLGGYYRKMGLEELAQKHIGKAMKSIFDSENEYNRACLQAICGNTEQAIDLLRVALKNKQTYVDWILRDPDLDFIRQDPRFKQLISDYTR